MIAGFYPPRISALMNIIDHSYHVIILNTGYTERLLERIDDIDERLIECDIMAEVNLVKYSNGDIHTTVEFAETVPGITDVCKRVPAVKNSQDFIAIDVRDIDGDASSMGTIHIIIEQLSDMGYCACLDATNIITELEFTQDGLRYLFISFDTESG